ncbi:MULTISPECIES: thioesterase II family protein [unclassified Acinetobacter]|uniref:thioesterase II family protein n=1 Tax=unclassified Acinetobacter TaxID=196816 RepID=UPI00190C4DBD|nr:MULTISPECIES: alpha/beta fold hydrolase [unclassified Acinetobacter]MBK0065081.1 thioesterase [Acinetobacter sp. S55]MBK0068205.1 thioesterase [Acinetobacter sp. S54]
MINNSKINLFCVPSAGSSASIYNAWNKAIAGNIKVIALEYPGHGRKIQQQLSNDPDGLAEQFAQEILTYGDVPCVLFGHSVGGSLIWKIEEKLKLVDADHNLILKIVSARPSPHFQSLIHHYSDMTDRQIVQELKLYNNFPDEILNNPSASEFFLRIIKNDFILSDNMLKKPIQKSLVPLISIYGKDDPYIQDHEIMQSWQNFSEQWLGAYQVRGDHFYFLDTEILQDTVNIIQDNIHQVIKRMSV